MNRYQALVAANARFDAAVAERKSAEDGFNAAAFKVQAGTRCAANVAAPDTIYLPSPVTRDGLIELVRGLISDGVIQVAEVIS